MPFIRRFPSNDCQRRWGDKLAKMVDARYGGVRVARLEVVARFVCGFGTMVIAVALLCVFILSVQ